MSASTSSVGPLSLRACARWVAHVVRPGAPGGPHTTAVVLVGDDAAADLVGRARRRLDHRDEDAQHEHGHQDGGHGGEGRDGVAAQRPQRLLEEEADPHGSMTPKSVV